MKKLLSIIALLLVFQLGAQIIPDGATRYIVVAGQIYSISGSTGNIELVTDSSPQLGGVLDLNGYDLLGTSGDVIRLINGGFYSMNPAQTEFSYYNRDAISTTSGFSVYLDNDNNNNDATTYFSILEGLNQTIFRVNEDGDVDANGKLGGSYLALQVTDTEPPTAMGRLYVDFSENRPKYYDGAIWKKVLLDGDITASGVTEGDKGDITVTNSGLTWSLDNDVVGAAELDNALNITWSGNHVFSNDVSFLTADLYFGNTSRLIANKSIYMGEAETVPGRRWQFFVNTAVNDDLQLYAQNTDQTTWNTGYTGKYYFPHDGFANEFYDVLTVGNAGVADGIISPVSFIGNLTGGPTTIQGFANIVDRLESLKSTTGIAMYLDTNNDTDDSFSILNGANATVFSVNEAGGATVTGNLGFGTLTDNSIEAEDLEATNAPTDGYFPSFDAVSGGVTWKAVTGTGSSQYTYSDKSTDNYTITDNDITNGGTATDKKIWNRFTSTLDSVYLTASSISAGLVGSPFILQNWGADSVTIRKGASTNFYIADSSAAVSADGITIKNRHPVTAVKSGTNDFFLQGNFTLWYGACASIYTTANAINDLCGVEANSAGVFLVTDPDITIATATATPAPQSGTYSIKLTVNNASGVNDVNELTLEGVTAGQNVTVSVYVQKVVGTSNITLALNTADGWSVGDAVTVTGGTGTWTEYTLTGTASENNPEMRITFLAASALNDAVAIDNLRITVN